jgi:MOSC domain-containing protein YiiM
MATASAEVLALYVGPEPGAEMESRDVVRAYANEGLEGDRFRATDLPGGRTDNDKRQVTLVAQESLDDIAAETGILIPTQKSRRNIITRGIQLNELVGRQFMIGDVLLEGAEICQPCAKMGEILGEDKAKVVKAMVHRSGLRARILTSGEIRRGDPIQVLEPALA